MSNNLQARAQRTHRSTASRLRLAYFGLLATVVALYALSGITIIRPHEVGLVLRFGELRKRDGLPVVNQPGVLLAWPAPIDRVVRVPVRKEKQLVLSIGVPATEPTKVTYSGFESLLHRDASLVLTGDQQAVAIDLSLRFRVKDPVAYALRNENTDRMVASCLNTVTTQTVAGWRVEDAMRLRRQSPSGDWISLPEQLQASAQSTLDQVDSGVLLTGLEIQSISPPQSTLAAFEAVQSARIQQQTMVDQANGERDSEVIRAETLVSEYKADARGKLAMLAAEARAQTEPFLAALDIAQAMGPGQYRDRRVHESWQEIIASAGKVMLVNPTEEGQLRIRVPSPSGSE